MAHDVSSGMVIANADLMPLLMVRKDLGCKLQYMQSLKLRQREGIEI